MSGVASCIFEIHSYSSGLEEFPRRSCRILGSRAVACFDVCADRNLYRAGNARDTGKHLFPRDALTIGISERKSNASGGRRDGGKARVLEDAGAGDVPDV